MGEEGRERINDLGLKDTFWYILLISLKMVYFVSNVSFLWDECGLWINTIICN